MCGRYTLSEMPEWSELHIRIPDELLLRPRYNAAPGAHQLVVTRDPGGQLTLGELRWGARAGQRMVQNARRESLGAPVWREHAGSRCVVPADGYVEWQKTPRGKQPLWLRDASEPGRTLWMAGLVLPDGFVIITTPPSEDVAAVHARMPALLGADVVDAWLSAPWSAARALLVPAPEGLLAARLLGARINSSLHDDARCLEAPEPAAQLQLFRDAAR
ncbi:MAG: SOS response-associated peptidase [Sandaracinaceae bacterium]|nr:SOS response-associated peptidase [Sandaracinaceae bacterium]